MLHQDFLIFNNSLERVVYGCQPNAAGDRDVQGGGATGGGGQTGREPGVGVAIGDVGCWAEF